MLKHQNVQAAAHYETGEYHPDRMQNQAYEDGRKAGIEKAKAIVKELRDNFNRRGLYGVTLIDEAIGKLR